MTCTHCHRETTLLVDDKSGLLIPLCAECQAKPDVFAEGTQNGKTKLVDLAVAAANENVSRELEVRTAQVQQLADMLRYVLLMFPELSTGLTSAKQQECLRRARAMLVECGL